MSIKEKLIPPFLKSYIIFYKENKPTYEQMMLNQIKDSINLKGKPNLQSLIDGTETWIVK